MHFKPNANLVGLKFVLLSIGALNSEVCGLIFLC